MSEQWRLIADIGGTNARFARADEAGAIRDEWVRPVQDYPSFEAALGAYLETFDVVPSFASAAIAAAGPVSRNEIVLTNNSWRVSEGQLARQLGGGVKVRLFNDLQAVALAIPHLSDAQVEISDCSPLPLAERDRMLAVNVGTGFGAASLLRTEPSWTSCPSEAGHMVLGAANRQELELFEQLSDTPLTVEYLLSGDGVKRLARHLRSGDREAAVGRNDGPDRFDLADGSPLAGKVAALLTAILARVCSNLTLASAAWGGVYFCGSVASVWWQVADHTEFRRCFAGNSKMTRELASTPIGLITTEHPAFVGLANIEL